MEQIDLLSDFLKKYPFCQSAHLLLAKITKDFHHSSFDRVISASSIHIPDRAMLFNLISAKKIFADQKIEVQLQKEEQVSLKTEFTETLVEEPELSIVEEETSIKEQESQLTEPELIPALAEFISKPHSFESWLSHYKFRSEGKEVSDNDADLSESEAPAFEIPGYSIEQEYPMPPDEEDLKAITKFTKEKPKPEKVFDEEKMVLKMAKKSITADENLATETLAKVYAMQGKTEKAISVYEKLILKYPFKSTYFANLIEELKNK